MANSVAETFGFLPEIVPSTSESRTPGAKHQMLPLHVISKLVSGTSTIGSSDEETTGAVLAWKTSCHHCHPWMRLQWLHSS